MADTTGFSAYYNLILAKFIKRDLKKSTLTTCMYYRNLFRKFIMPQKVTKFSLVN